MSEPAVEQVPPWTLGWRLQRALDWSGLSVQQMARELAVSRSTVSGWMNDRHAPRVIYVRAWAARCRVPYDWLVHGDDGQLPRVDSNHQPAGWQHDLENVPNRRPLTRPEIHALRKHFGPANGRRVIVRSDGHGSATLPIANTR